MSLFISTGEVSGDLYAAHLSEVLRQKGYNQEIWGMVGSQVCGVTQWRNNDQLHIMGLSGILQALPALLRLRNELAEEVIRRKPDGVVVIDNSDFHLPLIAKIRKLGYKGPVIYLSPPALWAWRQGRAKQLKRYCSLCLPLYDFEVDLLRRLFVPVAWEGSPLVDQFSAGIGEAPLVNVRQVALMPGSRSREVRTLLPLLMELGVELQRQGWEPVLSVAPGLKPSWQNAIRNNEARLPVSEVRGRELMASSRCVVGASGTVAVEAMLLDRFMVVLYKGTWLEWKIYGLVTHTDYVSIPNVLAQRFVYPELLQNRCRADLALAETLNYLESPELQGQVASQLAVNRQRMGEPGVMSRWADRILERIGQS